jgi:hypothetical protein
MSSFVSFTKYQILSHFQDENPTKLVVWNVDDTTIYITDGEFFNRYDEKKIKPYHPIPWFGKTYTPGPRLGEYT